MKNFKIVLAALLLLGFLLMQCTKKIPVIYNTQLVIFLTDSIGERVPGATVRLYKNAGDSGFTQISDSNGTVLFSNLDVALYYWSAVKGCQNNKNSQNTIGRNLISGSVLYGYSIMSETGTLQITNTSAEPYLVSNIHVVDTLISDTLFKITLNDTPYISYPKIGSYIIHTEKVSSPLVGKDTMIQIRCGDTSFIKLPY